MRALILTLIVACGAAAGYFGYRELRQRNLAAESATQEPAPPAAPATPPREFNPGNLQELLAGKALQALSVKCRPGDCSFSVKVAERRTCELGDFDILARALGAEERLTLSIEALSPDPNLPGESAALSVKDLLGFRRGFTLNGVHQYSRLGIFLCRDSRNEGYCAAKPGAQLVNFPGFGGKPADANYFFQPLVLVADDQFVSASAPTAPMDAAYFSLFEWVINHSNNTPAESLRQEKARAFGLAQTIGSLPLSVQNNEITITLARHANDCAVDKKHALAPIPVSATARKLQKLLQENPEAFRPYQQPAPAAK